MLSKFVSKNPFELYGIERERGKIKRQPDEGKGPIKQFAIEKMLRELAKEQIADQSGKFRYTNEVIWGHGSGAIRVKITPNLGALIDRKTEDLNGETFWATKLVYRIKEDYAGQEDVVVAELFDDVKDLSSQPNDAAKKEYKLMPLMNRIVDKVKQITDSAFVFQSLKKINDNHYTMLFNIRGAGVGQLVRQRKAGKIAAGIIEVAFYPDDGNIHCILTTIGIEGESDAWEIMVPYFMADFAPTQDIDEITAAIVSGLKTV